MTTGPSAAAHPAKLPLVLAAVAVVAVVVPAGLLGGAFAAPVAGLPDAGAIVRWGYRSCVPSTTSRRPAPWACSSWPPRSSPRRAAPPAGSPRPVTPAPRVSCGWWPGLLGWSSRSPASRAPLTDPTFGAQLQTFVFQLEFLRVAAISSAMALVVTIGAAVVRRRSGMVALRRAQHPGDTSTVPGGSRRRRRQPRHGRQLPCPAPGFGRPVGRRPPRARDASPSARHGAGGQRPALLNPRRVVLRGRRGVRSGQRLGPGRLDRQPGDELRRPGDPQGRRACRTRHRGLAATLTRGRPDRDGSARGPAVRATGPHRAGRDGCRVRPGDRTLTQRAAGSEHPRRHRRRGIRADRLPRPRGPLSGGHWLDWLTVWRIDWLWFGVSVLAVALYLVGVRRLRARGDSWPVLRTIGWVLGWAIFAWATCGAPGVYGRSCSRSTCSCT